MSYDFALRAIFFSSGGILAASLLIPFLQIKFTEYYFMLLIITMEI